MKSLLMFKITESRNRYLLPTNVFLVLVYTSSLKRSSRGGSRTATTSKMEHFVIIVNGWKLLTPTTKSAIMDVATVLDPPLSRSYQ